jgi:hypothetical protein
MRDILTTFFAQSVVCVAAVMRMPHCLVSKLAVVIGNLVLSVSIAMQRSRSLIILAGLLPVLGACDSLSRFGGGGAAPSPVAIAQPDVLQGGDSPLAAPVPSATRKALPAPSNPTTDPVAGVDDTGPLVAPGAAAPDDTLSPGTPSVEPGGQQLAGLPADPSVPGGQPTVATPRPPQPATPPSSSRVVGGWKVAEQNGTACKLNLSSAPFVDLSRASTSGCGPALARVNAWKLDSGEIVLFETGGAVAARLRGGGGSYSGAAVKTGAPVTINR